LWFEYWCEWSICKSFPLTSYGISDVILALHLHFDTRNNQDSRNVSSRRRQHFHPQGNSLVNISVRMRTEGLGHLKIFKHLTGNQNPDLPSCGAMRYPPPLPLTPIRMHSIIKNTNIIQIGLNLQTFSNHFQQRKRLIKVDGKCEKCNFKQFWSLRVSSYKCKNINFL
jgi:hypothetical protein